MKVKRTLAILVCFVMVFGLFTGCSGNSTKGTIKIGVSAPLTGADAADGLRMKQGVTLAQEEINKNGGILGKNIDLDIQDDQASQAPAVNAVNKLISDKVVASVGPHFSTSVQATDALFKKAGLPYFTGGTSVALETGNPYFHRVRPSDALSCQAIAKFCVSTLKATKVGIMYNNDTMGTGGRDVMQNYFKSQNTTYVAEGHNTGDKDFSATLSKFKAAGVDTVVTCTHDSETAGIAKQIKQLGWTVNKVSTASMSMLSVEQLAGQDASDGWYAIQDYVLDSNDKNMVAFEKNFKAKYNTPVELYAATYYSTMYILADAIKAANSADSEKINEALKKTNYTGAMGTYKWTSAGNMVHQTHIVLVKNLSTSLVEAIKES